MVGIYYFLMIDPNRDPNPFLMEATRLNDMSHNHVSNYGLDGDLFPECINHVARDILYHSYLERYKCVLKKKLLDLLKTGALLEMSVHEIEDALI